MTPKSPLPVDVCRSKTLLLKLPVNMCSLLILLTTSMPSSLLSLTQFRQCPATNIGGSGPVTSVRGFGVMGKLEKQLKV